MNRLSISCACTAAFLAGQLACSSAEPDPSEETGGTNAVAGSGGSSGAAPAAGRAGSSTGATSGGGTPGGATSSGGATSVGGATPSGGTTGSGGATNGGGTTTSGGAPAGGTFSGQGGAPSNAGGASQAGAAGGSGAPAGGRSAGGASSSGGRGAGNGGTPSSGGASGGGMSSGGSGGSGGALACNVDPVTANASQQAKNLLCYLYSIKGNHVLSGQQETNWNANPTDIAWYASNIGKYPAILGSDFLYRDGVSCSSVTPSTTRAIAYWKEGGISMMRYHMGMPGAGLTCTADCYEGSNCAEPATKPTGSFFTNVVTAGTPENTSLNAKLDYVAVQLGAMQAANVPVIFALYHETQPNGWFWWAQTSSGSAFVNLWIYSFNYLTKTKGLTNILWLMPFSGSPNAAFYPGKAYVDIGGPDEYTQPSNLATFTASTNYNPAAAILGSSMPIALHETGTAVQPDYMFPNTAPWVLWNVWSTYENTSQSGFTFNTIDSLKAAYASPYTVTRDEIPNLK
jgi:beta-mannanase